MAFRTAPTRPGVECSWCSTIKTVGRRATLAMGMGKLRRDVSSPPVSIRNPRKQIPRQKPTKK
jgi:hypothetical protein